MDGRVDFAGGGLHHNYEPTCVAAHVQVRFAVQDDTTPGRLYAGVTTAGRSAKFGLQAVSASLLQMPEPMTNDRERDAYWTLAQMVAHQTTKLG